MKQKIIYTNSRGEEVEFSNQSFYFTTKVDGLNGIKSNLISNKGVNQDGVTLINANLEPRNIVIEGKVFGETEYNKEKLINVVNPKGEGKLTYIKDDIKKEIGCAVEISPVISREVTAPNFVISFLCPNPYWKSKTNILNIASWIDEWEFDWEIDDFEFGCREKSLLAEIVNDSADKCGMIIEFKALGTLKNPSLFNVNTREYIKINRNMSAGEVIKVNTEYDNKRVELINNNTTVNIINDMDWESDFLQLYIGNNVFRYDADSNLDNLEVTIRYNKNYTGVV